MISAPLRKLLSSPYKVIVDHYQMNATIVSILTWASLLQLVGLLVVEGVVETTVDLFVGGSLSSFSFVKIVLYNLSWNSFANIAACLSGLSFSSVFLSQSQVMFLLQVPVSKIQDITRTYGKIGWGRFLTCQHQLTNCRHSFKWNSPLSLYLHTAGI